MERILATNQRQSKLVMTKTNSIMLIDVVLCVRNGNVVVVNARQDASSSLARFCITAWLLFVMFGRMTWLLFVMFGTTEWSSLMTS
jgi:hypothetical protein